MADTKILLVEDESIEAMDIKRTLESLGYEVPYVAASGEEAIEKATEIVPDLILMDIVLKGEIDGIGAVSKIRDLNIPVIYLTAHSEDSTIERAKLTEPAGYIIKPYDGTELKYAVELAIYKNQMEKKRKKVEEELLHTNEWLGYVQRAVKIGFWDWDLVTGKLTWPTELFELFGLPKTDEPSFDLWLDILHPDDRELAMENINLALQEHKILENECRIIRPNGKEIWVSAIGSTVYDEDGQPLRMSGICLDITERKQSQKLLKESEGLLRGLFDNMPSGMAVYQVKNDGSKGNDYIIKEFNQTSQKIEGISREEVIGKSLSAIRPNIDDYGLIPVFKKVWETGEPIVYPAKIYVDEQYANWYENHVFKAPTGEIVAIYNDVTQEKVAAEELRESEAFLDNIVENIPAIIFVKNVDKLDFAMVNKAGQELIGYSLEEVVGKNVHDFFSKCEADFFTKKDREVIENKQLVDIPEETIETKNWGKRILHTKKIPLLDKEGKTQYILGISEDITKLKEAEKALIKSEKRYRTLYSSMNEGVAIHELIYDDNLPVDYKIIDVNPAFEKILGINKEEVLERKASKLYNTKKAPYLDIYSKVVETGNPEYFETYFEPFDQHFRISVFSPSEEAFVTVFEDITLRKRSELKLKESEEQINAIFNTVNSGIILIDTEGFIRIANQHMTKMFGFNHSQFIGMSYLDLINNKERTASETDMGKLINGEVDNLFIERQYKRKDSSVFWGNLSGTRILNEDGSLKGLIGVITNITDLKKSNDALKNSLKEKDALLMEVHHRVKNNMQIISSLLNLQINHEDSDEIIKVLKESQGRVKSMAMIHEKLYQSPSFNNISFKNYVERLVFDIFYSYGIKTDSIESVLDIEDINLNIETAIPLGLIINELVTNSVKHAFSKGEGTIIIKLKSSPNHMQLIVADDGIGIPKNIDIGKTETLGLKLVNSLADQLDGELHLDSSHGTEFKLIFKELEYKERI
ncbi:MAG: PAS domain S-box protein [Methanobacterium sp.]|jgi:PAS domain S-box-containing protein|uniref:PAS domain S-box protein n=1 Tax=Methanobacterium sp. TaxID=2164 RepID=UPI003D91BA97